MKLILLILLISYIYSDDPYAYDTYSGNTVWEDCGKTIFSVTQNNIKFYRQNYVNAKSVDDCQGKQLEYQHNYYITKRDEDKIKSEYTHCCYYTYDGFEYDSEKNYNSDLVQKVEREGGCIALTDAEYNNIGEYIKFKQREEEYYNYNLKLDCFSNYLKTGLLNIILLILF